MAVTLTKDAVTLHDIELNDVWDQMSHAQAEGDLWCARQAGDIVQDYDTTDREGNPLRVVLVVQSLIIDHPDLGGVYEFTC